MTSELKTGASVTAVNGNIVSIEVPDGHIVKNEVAYVCLGDKRLKSEVLRVYGNEADLQVFEDTEGVKVGDAVELTHQLLSASLGPGLLGCVFDGLQNPLETLANRHGFFLQRGHYADSLDRSHKWSFVPLRRTGERLRAGDNLGTVQERGVAHKIMVPFNLSGQAELTWIQGGSFTIDEPIARVRDAQGERPLTMRQEWPVRIPLPADLLQLKLVQRMYPSEPLVTTIRTIDTFYPIARGGTACIPGPFGAGKTVLQTLIARYSAVDVVIVVACGERAGEVVDTINEFSQAQDPRGGGSLMDRTVIICNTSSMPVAAREASIYTGITLGEYYRQMGLDVLLLADSTSRWAQAMRETSGRLEEIPGEEAFPAYLDSAIKGVYERAGVITARDGSLGSLTMIGTVSPAGGNFEEPVTQSTLGTVKTFLGLSYDRAYKRFYPAIDPLLSWSRYREQLQEHLDRALDADWTAGTERLLELLRQADAIYQMMQVTGEEGISLQDFVTLQKANFLDTVYLQQDAFDPVDVATPMDRQQTMLGLVKDVTQREFLFSDKDEARDFFVRITNAFLNLNYSATGSSDYEKFLSSIQSMLSDRASDA
ncbi:V-type ATP synthase subunit A [Planctomycetes bacterium TBK1r]|uniref:V-type ATP synthase alpha chain n=1 Tax=Stieleria magnilauensis TaxID=2527963 RepID=A0ABX5XV33_9BACT|nr:V-type sodium ATPase catalytic subunit A [Planctomycetes bacterium TBK1r]